MVIRCFYYVRRRNMYITIWNINFCILCRRNYISKSRPYKEKYGINTCLHVILNLFETYDEMMETAKTIAKLEPEGVKIHMLCALEGTKLAEMYKEGEIDFMSEDEYVNTVCDFLEYLPPETTIHRLAGNGLRTELVAPRWIGKKLDCLNKTDREFLRRDTRQGSRFIK